MRLAVTLAAAAATALACTTGPQTPTPTPAPTSTTAQAPGGGGGPGGAPGQPAPQRTPAQMDSMRKSTVARMVAQLGARADEPAERVYQNIQVWKGLPARALLDTMASYGRALGVTCSGCHVPGQWASEERANKKVARGMQRMTTAINTTHLPAIPDLDPEHPPATCAMCHQGSFHPKTEVSLTGRGESGH